MVQAYFLFQCAYDLNSKTKQIIYYTSEEFNGYTLLVRTKHLLIDFTCKQRKNITVNQMLANASTDPFICQHPWTHHTVVVPGGVSI